MNSERKTKKDHIPIESLKLSPRSELALKNAGFNFVSDFIGKDYYDIFVLRNVGNKSLSEIIVKLSSFGLRLNNNWDLQCQCIPKEIIIDLQDYFEGNKTN